jgi:hypothetical protein
MEGQLSELISAARNLQHLRFETRQDPERALDGCVLRTVFDVQINPDLFPNLCSLSLERIKISGLTLQRFLMAHSGTLKCVRLQDIQMNDETDCGNSGLRWRGSYLDSEGSYTTVVSETGPIYTGTLDQLWMDVRAYGPTF